VLNFEDGVTITTGLNNGTGNALITSQVVTVTGTYAGADDIDGDGVANWVDIDTDDDGIWDKYELPTDTDSDGDGVADYRDTDSNGGAAGDDRSNASLSQGQIDALEAGTASNSDGYILLSDAGVTLDLTLVETVVSNLEYIDMEDGANAQTVKIDPGSLLNVTGAPNVLIIVGDAGDTVNATDFVNTQKDTSIEGQTFSIYEGRTVEDTLTTLLIDDDISVFLA